MWFLWFKLTNLIQGDPPTKKKKQNPYIFVEVIMGSVFFLGGEVTLYLWSTQYPSNPSFLVKNNSRI